jgi:hypothetical protein
MVLAGFMLGAITLMLVLSLGWKYLPSFFWKKTGLVPAAEVNKRLAQACTEGSDSYFVSCGGIF